MQRTNSQFRVWVTILGLQVMSLFVFPINNTALKNDDCTNLCGIHTFIEKKKKSLCKTGQKDNIM